MPAFLFYSPFSTFLTHSTLLLLYPFLFSFSILFQRYKSHLCSVPSVFSFTYRRLDGDNKVKNYLCYLIPHTTKSLIFPNALHFIPALITCMELFVCPQNRESSLTTIRLVCITKDVQEYATFMYAFLFYSPFYTFLTRSTLLLLYPFLFSFSILLQRYRLHLCWVPSIFHVLIEDQTWIIMLRIIYAI